MRAVDISEITFCSFLTFIYWLTLRDIFENDRRISHIHLQFKCSANELADLLFWKISTGKKIINFIHWTWFYKLSNFFHAFKKTNKPILIRYNFVCGSSNHSNRVPSWMKRERKVVSIWIPHWIYQIDNWNQFRW